jgi:hypothetical protein
LMNLCKSKQYITADDIFTWLMGTNIDPDLYQKVVGPAFKIFESEQLIKDTKRTVTSKRNGGNLIKVWRSLLF